MKENFKTKTGKLVLFNGLLAFFIILWGAWVRLSGSGAGCGDHWPLCHGEVIPLSASLQTLIEFTHRFTSGLFGITVLLQLVFSYKEFGKSHPETKATWSFLILTIIEALIGAVLVKKGLVVDNSSAMRAWVIGLHLVNTLLLMGSFVYCFHFLNLPMGLKKREFTSSQKAFALFGLGLFLAVSAFGAITALGNTLFPSPDLVAGLKSDFDPDAPFLIRLRIYHPALAVLTGIFWIIMLNYWKEKLRGLERSCSLSLSLIFIAIGFGVVNWLLMAPHWGALVHLALADLTWMALVSTYLHRSYLIPQDVI